MVQSQLILVTTRLRAAVAVGLTAFVLVQAVRGVLNLGNTPSGWLVPWGSLLDGWPLVAVNVFFYGYMWWLGYWFIRGTRGRERVLIVGWFAGILLWPLETLKNGWVMEIRYVAALGLAVALIAGVSLLMRPSSLRTPV